MKLLLTTTLMLIAFAQVNATHAQSRHYESCKQSLNKNVAVDEIEKVCGCVERNFQKYKSRGAKNDRDKMERIVKSCYNSHMPAGITEKMYDQCVTAPEYQSKKNIKAFCKCMSSIYGKRMMSRGIDGLNDTDFMAKMQAKADKESKARCASY
jgi:hypothetical protein